MLSRQTGHERQYGANPYSPYNPYNRYDTKESTPLFEPGVIDNRLEWLKQPVVGTESGTTRSPSTSRPCARTACAR